MQIGDTCALTQSCINSQIASSAKKKAGEKYTATYASCEALEKLARYKVVRSLMMMLTETRIY